MRQYIAIDLKSFYASVEAAERGYDPLDVNLVVADESRTDKTICLAVSPPLKALGVPGRGRLFEVKQRVRELNRLRRARAPGGRFTGKSVLASELAKNPALELDFLIAPPRMRYYMDYSRSIVEIYLRHVSPDDLLVYSIDEVFIDATPYLRHREQSARAFAMELIRTVLQETRVTATAGIGTNLYLAKIVMDIVAKHLPADRDGVRIAELDERSYREQLWCHRPLTDFWRVGKGIARKLERNGLYTMGDVARCSLGKPGAFYSQALLYRLFGVNAELLIDHAWGWEPTEIADCKAYRPDSKSLSQGQVLSRPYAFAEGRVVVQEMADQLALELVRQELVTDLVELTVNYDVENLRDPVRAAAYRGPIVRDHYGRDAPKPAHGLERFDRANAAPSRILAAVRAIYDRTVDPNLSVRRFCVVLGQLRPAAQEAEAPEQLDLFGDWEARRAEQAALEREQRRARALLQIRARYGKNAILKGLNFEQGATAIERNRQVGGHRA